MFTQNSKISILSKKRFSQLYKTHNSFGELFNYIKLKPGFKFVISYFADGNRKYIEFTNLSAKSRKQIFDIIVNLTFWQLFLSDIAVISKRGWVQYNIIWDIDYLRKFNEVYEYRTLNGAQLDEFEYWAIVDKARVLTIKDYYEKDR